MNEETMTPAAERLRRIREARAENARVQGERRLEAMEERDRLRQEEQDTHQRNLREEGAREITRELFHSE